MANSVEYEVFLSFTGKDTRNGFTGYLFEALKHKGVRTFMDDEELESGKRIDESLWRAIEDSAVCIVILSEHYADSKWCLKELAKMVLSNTNIFPVSYHVDPSDVRRQKGPYEEAFRDYERRCCLHPDDKEHIKEEEVREWKKALTEVGDLSGFHLDNQKEAQLIQIIVKKVLHNCKPNALDLTKHLVGIERRVDKMMELLNIEAEDVRMIGICGMGGIGKSTLAKVIYNTISNRFDAVCFIENIREAARNGLVELQKKLVSQIAKIDNPAIYGEDQGATEIRQRCRCKKVIIILDDVDNEVQLNKLAGERDWFEKGSRVIITTREKHVLNVHHVKDHEIYRPEEMDRKESLELFSWHAFGRSQPLDPFMEISREVVRVTGGLPLALEVLGSELFDKIEKGQWKEMLKKLKRVPQGRIQERLKISYDGLDQEQKTIFLDIACLFIGKEREYVNDALKACGFASKLTIQVLLHKSLLKIDEDDDTLEMHDQLRDMGRNIANRSRIWDRDDAWDVLNDRKGSENIKCLLIDLFGAPNKSLSTEAFTKMSSMRLLRINHVNVEGDFSKMPKSLRWLEWHDCPLESLPEEFDLKRIGYLDLSFSRMVGLWDEGNECGNKVFQDLRVLKLEHCRLQKSPNFDRLPNLKKISLRGCKKLGSLDESIGRLRKLIVFDLFGCEALTHLPDSIRNMKKLRELNLKGTEIRELPLSIGSLHNLEKLFLTYCDRLRSLPDSIGNLNKLHELNLDETKIRELPLSIGSLHNLEKLSLSYSDKLSLPDSIGNLNKLRYLYLCKTKIREIPLSICSLQNLEELSLWVCDRLRSLPDSIGNLNNLHYLNLVGTKIRELPLSIGSLHNLETLSLTECDRLRSLPDSFGNLNKLRYLYLCKTNIRELPLSIGSLHNLEKLYVSGCDTLRSLLDSIGNLNKLRELSLSGTKIRELPLSIGSLHNLEELSLTECDRLRSLPDSIGNLNKLRELDLRKTKIRELPLSVGSLHNLEKLSLTKCDRLRSLPDSIGNLNKLRELYLVGTKTRELPLSVGSLHNLEKLSLTECDRLRSLPDSIGNLNKLRELDLRKTKIRELPLSVGSLHNLVKLSLTECDRLRSLPDSICNMKKLHELNLKGTKIRELPLSIGSLHNLVKLSLTECDRLRSLPDSICNMKKLRELNLKETKIRELPLSISALQNLRHLDVTGCNRLRSLPDSIGDLTKIDELKFHNCTSLRALPNSIGIMKSLVSITISEASIQELPDSIGSLLNLKTLKMEGCSRLRRLPDSIGGLTKLEKLIISGCKQISALPHSIVGLTELETLNLSGYKQISALPHSLGNLVNLKELSLDRTHIKELPRSIVSLEKLEKLDIHGTKLTTPLPLWELKSLKTLIVGDIDGEEEEVDLENKIESDGEEPAEESNEGEEGEESSEESNKQQEGEESDEESNEGEEGEESSEESNEQQEGEESAEESPEELYEEEEESKLEEHPEEVLISGYSKKTQEYRKIYRQFPSSYYWTLLISVGNQERYIHLVLDQQSYRIPGGHRGWQKLIFPSDFVLESISSGSDERVGWRDNTPPSALEANAHAAATVVVNNVGSPCRNIEHGIDTTIIGEEETPYGINQQLPEPSGIHEKEIKPGKWNVAFPLPLGIFCVCVLIFCIKGFRRP